MRIERNRKRKKLQIKLIKLDNLIFKLWQCIIFTWVQYIYELIIDGYYNGILLIDFIHYNNLKYD